MLLVPLAVLLAMPVCLPGCNAKRAPVPAAPAAPDLKVKASDLLREFSNNAVAADAKYKGKVLQVSGKFNSVKKMVVYFLQLAPDDAAEGSLSYVQCTLADSAKDDVANLKEGQAVVIQRTCDGALRDQVKT